MMIHNAGIVAKEGKRYLVIDAPFSQIEHWLSANQKKFPCKFEIKEVKKKRSNDANAYMWQLADKIAAAVGITKEEVYQSHIRDVGKFTDLIIDKRAVADFMQAWGNQGVGWFAEVIDDYSEVQKRVRAYQGSSVYNSAEMARLIDNMVQEAKSLTQYGVYIETLTPDELKKMLGTGKNT